MVLEKILPIQIDAGEWIEAVVRLTGLRGDYLLVTTPNEALRVRTIGVLVDYTDGTRAHSKWSKIGWVKSL